jgi:D-alanyl-lipoteichoic acid acyltransferase DltB (MBOAT superfamily)
MTIASFAFLGFALVVALLYNLARPVWWRQGVFLVANLSFLASFSSQITTFIPLAGFMGLGYAGIWLMQSGKAARWFWPLLGALVLAFFWLKKYSFLPSSSFLGMSYVTIGLSYIFFRVVHCLIDAHDGNLPGRVGVVGYLNYTLNFTSLVSGPIQLYPDFAETQLGPVQPPITWFSAGWALERIIIGFFKTIVMAALFSTLYHDALDALPAQLSLLDKVGEAVIVTVSYTIYLYFNFSGYTDIVIGVARFLRLELPENFNRPFSATSFLDFWARWHMTLSNWLKIYVYNPLVKSLMERFPSPAIEPFLGVAAFFFTFFLIGLWHGQTPIFAVYGLLLGLGVSGNKLYQNEMIRRLGRKRYRAVASRPVYQFFARGLTFTWFTLSLVCFWGTGAQVRGLLDLMGWAGVALLALTLFLGASVVLGAAEAIRNLALGITVADEPVLRSRYIRTIWGTAIGVIAIATILLMATPAPDVVYKTF